MLCSTASGNASRAKVLLALSVLTLLGKSRAGLVAGVLRGVLTISFFPSRRPGAQGLVKCETEFDHFQQNFEYEAGEAPRFLEGLSIRTLSEESSGYIEDYAGDQSFYGFYGVYYGVYGKLPARTHTTPPAAPAEHTRVAETCSRTCRPAQPCLYP